MGNENCLMARLLSKYCGKRKGYFYLTPKFKIFNSAPKCLYVYGDKDRLSRLPDEVLVSILSLLTTKEARRTSVLSRRWLKLWTFVSNVIIDFPDNHMYDKKEKIKFINWVNNVFQFYNRAFHTIAVLKIQISVNTEYNDYVNGWISFALGHEVKNFELDFRIFGSDQLRPCEFPALLHPHPLGYPICKTLTSLVLKAIDVKSDVLEFFISTCPLLESLCISYSKTLRDLNVSQTLSLKHLEIFYCKLSSLELDTTSLVSFKYCGERNEFPVVASVPNLVDLHYYGACSVPYSSKNFSMLPIFASQIQQLTLRFDGVKKWKDSCVFPIFSQLWQLKLEARVSENDSLLFFSCLINVSPFLHKLELEVEILHSHSLAVKARDSENFYDTHPHYCLEAVSVVGFQGKIVDTDFLLYLIKIAPALDKIVIDPHPARIDVFGTASAYDQHDDMERTDMARERARKLGKRFNLGEDKLVIL